MNSGITLALADFVRLSAFTSSVVISIFVAQLLFSRKKDSKIAERLRGFVSGMVMLTFISLFVYLWFYAKA